MGEKLDVSEARQAVVVAEQRYVNARRRSEAVTPGGLVGYDSAILSGTTRRRNGKREASRHAAYDAEATAARELERAHRALEAAELQHKLETAEAATRARLTPEAIRAATHVRTRRGWHQVVRVNTKTVSVESGYSWIDRIPMADIVDVRPSPAAPPQGGEG